MLVKTSGAGCKFLVCVPLSAGNKERGFEYIVMSSRGGKKGWG